MAAATGPLGRYFDRQLPPGRAAIIADDSAQVEVRFKILEAQTLPAGRADAFIVLREFRVDERPNRASMYWYGLNEQLASGEWLYEAFHLHDEPGEEVRPHFQVEVRSADDRLRLYERSDRFTPVHLVPAVEELMARYYVRLAEAEPE